VYSLAFCQPDTPTAGIFASGSKDGNIALWDVYANKMFMRHNDDKEPVKQTQKCDANIDSETI
jgi:hypothetical protein